MHFPNTVRPKASAAIATRLSQRAAAERQEFLRDVCDGLSQTRKTLPCKYFYDVRGSRLFDQICELPEYYPTRTEAGILQTHRDDILDAIGDGVVLLEPGSGSSRKTRLLLQGDCRWRSYVPMDISGEYLAEVAEGLRQEFPWLPIHPIAADFTSDDEPQWPKAVREANERVLFFPGSTIGNFPPLQAVSLLRRFARWSDCNGGLLIGFDLQKDIRVLEEAYDDAAGVTAAFNLNLLTRINRELSADFILDEWQHRSVYDTTHHRIEMQLISRSHQSVRVGGQTFHFRRGESICTEHSHKYSIESFEHLAGSGGWNKTHVWTDEERRFAVMLLHRR